MTLKIELEEKAQVFNHFWIRYLEEQPPVSLYQASRHLPQSGGKRLRPVLTMVACESVGGTAEHTFPFAAALEFMHNFTLVHDDIMDHSHLRRNVPTVHVEYGEPTAILAGDLLFAKSFEAMHDLEVSPAVFKTLERELIQCIVDICEGQQWDMEFEQRNTVSEREYMTMIEKKTGVLFRLSSRGGGMIGEGTAEEIDALTTYGSHLGLAFQIWDDYLDMSSDEATLGKDIGNDIRNGKKTLIAVHAFEHATGDDQTLITKVFGHQQATNEDIRHVLDAFQSSGSIQYAKDVARRYHDEALQVLHVLPVSDARHILEDLVSFAIERKT